MHDVIIIGAGAAGLMCAIEAGKRGRRGVVIDHAAKIGEKIRISGGGRCNFTNLHTTPANFLSQNPRFCISALKRYTPAHFIGMVERYGIAWHEKTLGQLFCDGSAQQIIDMLVAECNQVGAVIRAGMPVSKVLRTDNGFTVETLTETLRSHTLVIATGGKSIPKIGASGFAYEIAGQFGLSVIEPRPALVPFTFTGNEKDAMASLAGVSVDGVARCGVGQFAEALLFTHRGLSGPAILQVSSYWNEGRPVHIDLSPGTDTLGVLKSARKDQPKLALRTVLSNILPKRVGEWIAVRNGCDGRIAELSDKKLQDVAKSINDWQVLPSGTEGYRTAEVTLGGIDTREISSKTFEANSVPGLYVIGEALDVTGHLGGFNFQWAWSSGWCAGQVV